MDVKYCFYLNSKIFKVKIESFNVKNKQVLIEFLAIASVRQTLGLSISGDCVPLKVASIAPATQMRWYGFHFSKKLCAILGTFIAYYSRLRPADVCMNTFSILTIININNKKYPTIFETAQWEFHFIWKSIKTYHIV